MDINRDNYEAWLLDHMEGNLTAGQVQQLRDFLLLNPDCEAGLEELEPLVLKVEAVSYPGKTGLRRALPDHDSVVSAERFDLFSIARMEGDLTKSQEEDHQRLVDADEEKFVEWLAWKKTRLAGEAIPYKGKRALKKSYIQRSRVLWISFASAAAAIMLFFIVFPIDQGESPSDEFVSQEQESIIEPAGGKTDPAGGKTEPEAEELIPQAIVESSNESLVLASEPGILSIQKRPDPPELTGVKRDTTVLQAKKASLQPGPVRLAQLEKGLVKMPLGLTQDRIAPLDLPPLTSSSEKSVFKQLSEKGLRQSYHDFVDENDISILTIASAGVEGINFLAGSDLSLNLTRDEEGKVSGFRYRSELLSVDTPVKKAE